MANSIVAIYTHIIFAVKYRNAVLDDRWRDNMFKYIHTMIENRGNPCIIVGGYRDHVHILCNLKESVDELVRALKLATGNRIRKISLGLNGKKDM